MKYIEVQTKKQLHGWYLGKRECTAERMLINPYNGCSVGCFYCYARALPGYFEKFHKEGTIFVWKDFDKTVKSQLDSLKVVSCGYLSPITDPFQKINEKYQLSEKIISVFIEQNIPIEFITKCAIPNKVIELIKKQKHSFGQISILTTDENLRKIFAPGGAKTYQLFNNLTLLAKNNIYSVCRIDPIFPYITDRENSLKELINRAIDSGANHIIASIVDIPAKIYGYFMQNIKRYFGWQMYLKYRELFVEKIGYINSKIDYRKNIFSFLRSFCDEKKISFALCMEYENNTVIANPITSFRTYSVKQSQISGLNKIYSSSKNCEGIDIPVYIKNGKKFAPVDFNCYGNCLNCEDAKCGIDELAMANKSNNKKSFKLSDYKKWSKHIIQPKLNMH